MTYKRAECLILVPKPEVCKGSECRERSRATRGTRNTAQKGKSVRGYVLLSSEFIEQHPKLVQLFDKNSLLIVQNRDVPRLPATDEEINSVFEIFLLDSPSASVDPLSISTDHVDISIFHRLICYTTVVFSRKVWKASDMRPAVDDSNREAFRRLVARSFQLGYYGTGGILHLASYRGQEVLMRTALENGAEINGKSTKGATALHVAAREGSISLVKMLLKRGAAINKRDGSRETPLLCASNAKAQKILLHSGADPNRSDSGADLNSADSDGERPVFSAFWHRSLELMEILLDYGAQVDARDFIESFIRFIKPHRIFYINKLQLLLEYGLIDPEPLTNQLGTSPGKDFCWITRSCIGKHVVKVMALHGLTDLRNVNVEEYWDGAVSHIARFRQECDAEVDLMKSHKLSGTDVSMRDALARSDYHLYRLLKNPAMTRAIGPALISKQYPIYGRILNHHFRKGRHRRWLQREGVKSLKLLSRGFHRLPDEIQEEVVNCLSTVDILKLRRASAGQS